MITVAKRLVTVVRTRPARLTAFRQVTKVSELTPGSIVFVKDTGSRQKSQFYVILSQSKKADNSLAPRHYWTALRYSINGHCWVKGKCYAEDIGIEQMSDGKLHPLRTPYLYARNTVAEVLCKELCADAVDLTGAKITISSDESRVRRIHI